MPKRYWTVHWQNRYWHNRSNPEGEPIQAAGSNQFIRRGVSPGDSVYVVSLRAGRLLLGGRMTAKKIVSRDEASRITGSSNLYPAHEWVVDPEREGTRLNLQLGLDAELAKKIRVITKSGVIAYTFVTEPELDTHTTRGVRELTPESAALLDRILDRVNRGPTQTGEMVVAAADLQE